MVFVGLINASYAEQDVVSLFPMSNYDQNIATWIKPDAPDYDKPILNSEIQQQHYNKFLEHYVGGFSPWNREYISNILHQSSPDDLKSVEQGVIDDFSNDNKEPALVGYGENFRPYNPQWINNIAQNINLSQLENFTYQNQNRAITIDNLPARALPTFDVHFYHHKIAGQGFPFDNLQESAMWAGTPVYIISETNDKAWMLAASPEYIAWVPSKGIARVDEHFINRWTTAANNKLAAITRTKSEVIDKNGSYLFSAYVGSVFPAHKTVNGIEMMVPAANANHTAVIKNVLMPANSASIMPLLATPHHFATLMQTLIGRPYGWGGMYFYNDCSLEMKSLLTPFGIWLPRHSADQVTVGKMDDLTYFSPEKRLNYLKDHGKRFLSLIYIDGHVVMYIGSYDNPNKPGTSMAMTYQNMWGLRPHTDDRRVVIGGAVLFPLLPEFPEDTELTSQASKKYFQISYLDELGPSFKQPSNLKIHKGVEFR